MDDVARDARIFRPGLYLYFSSKQTLLHAAVEHALARDVSRAEALLVDQQGPLIDRLLDALDLWAGQYIGHLATDLEGLLEQDVSLLGELPTVYAERFRNALTRGLRQVVLDPQGNSLLRTSLSAEQVADVVLALTAGTKRQAATRDDFRERLGRGLELLLCAAAESTRREILSGPFRAPGS